MDADLARYLEGEPVQRAGREAWGSRDGRCGERSVRNSGMGSLPSKRGRRSSFDRRAAVQQRRSADRYLSSGANGRNHGGALASQNIAGDGPAAVLQFRGKTTDVLEAGRALRVTNVLEGTVARDGRSRQDRREAGT